MKLLHILLVVLPIALAADSSNSPTTACKCALVKCPGDQPALCKCRNEAAIRCAELCGTKPPKLQYCPKPSPTTTSTIPSPTTTVCGSRGLPPCPDGTTCVNNPTKPGCDIAADCPGLCVKLDGPFCGGIANIQCPDPAQLCFDDPNDGCGPPFGADCGGICAYPDGRSSAVATADEPSVS